mmetsp:Transcript_20004/g.27779  ORF Transcript_20004/g.27779 Transcript_20004/m.27779 type:complete len:146 (+) Transcript_20004:50-487(+)|eukprot:jgi/Bigna1/85009/estExt_fgenesh1_pg.C_10592
MVSDRSLALCASVVANVALLFALVSVSQQGPLAAPMTASRGITTAAMPRFASRVAPRAMYYGRMPVMASNEEVFAKVQDIVASQLSIEKEKVSETSTFADLGADSLDTVEIVMAIEEAFGVEVPEDAAAEMSNLKEAVDYIVTKA